MSGTSHSAPTPAHTRRYDRRRLLVAAAALLVTLGAILPAPADAQWLEVRPTVVLAGGPTVGVRLTSAVSRERDLIGPYPRSWHIASFADAPLLLDPERNTETVRARLDGGLLVSLFRPSTPVGAAPSPNDPEPWNFGFVSVQTSVGVEVSQEGGNADLTIGAGIEYGHDQYHRRWFLPEVRIGWDYVVCAGCGEGPSEDASGNRWQAEARWNIPADREWMPSPLRPLWLRLHGRAFTSSGLTDTAALRNEDGLWGSAELAYRCDACGRLHEVYVRGQSGRLPVALREQRSMIFGVAF